MSDDGDTNAKSRILDVLVELDEVELESIETWICSRAYKNDLEQKRSLQSSNKMLRKIGDTIKKLVPFEAEMPSENIVAPTVGDQADCNVVNTLHVDGFLYDEDDVEKLAKKGKIKRQYCVDCNSRNIKDLIFISHSLSREALQYLFSVLLPNDLEHMRLLDVGSRLGNVLYGAYYLSNVGSITGIEMNKECVEIQEKIINQYSMDDNRIKVIHSDVMDKSDIVSNANIIVINVLDFFVNNQKHRDLWYFFKKHLKKGTYLVSNRSMTDTLVALDMFEELMNWLIIWKPCQMDNEMFFNIEECSQLFLYRVN